MSLAARRWLAAFALAAAVQLSAPARATAPARRYKAAGGIVTDLMTRLLWQQLVSASVYTFDTAKAYCQGLDLNGTGWRVPTIKELQTIVDPISPPGIDPVFLPTTDPAYSPDSAKGPYWSSTVSARYSEEAWTSNGTYAKSISVYVRCVR